MDLRFRPIGSTITFDARIDEMSVECRRNLFNHLLRDPAVVTEQANESAMNALYSAVESACYWRADQERSNP